MKKLKVRYTVQQKVLLQSVINEGTYGKTLEELTVTLLRAYASQILGREFKK